MPSCCLMGSFLSPVCGTGCLAAGPPLLTRCDPPPRSFTRPLFLSSPPPLLLVLTGGPVRREACCRGTLAHLQDQLQEEQVHLRALPQTETNLPGTVSTKVVCVCVPLPPPLSSPSCAAIVSHPPKRTPRQTATWIAR